MIAVSDTGCGIPPELRTKIFEPFFTTKGLGHGSGLGLASVYGILRQNRGFIVTYSEVGIGTTFKLYIPRDKNTSSSSPPEHEGDPNAGTETILLVEDDLAILHMTERALRSYGYTLISTTLPETALVIAREQYVDLLITDVVMPNMSGKILAENLAAIQPKTKTLFISGYTADIISRHGLIDPDIHFLQKPFSTRTLAATIRAILDDEAPTPA
jgi:CheY-like chemotaxis protein